MIIPWYVKVLKVYYTYIIKEIILPPDLLSPITGIEIERLASRLSRLAPATPVTVDAECWRGWGRCCCCDDCWCCIADGCREEDCCWCDVFTPLERADEEWWWDECWAGWDLGAVCEEPATILLRTFPYDWRWRTPSILFISYTT